MQPGQGAISSMALPSAGAEPCWQCECLPGASATVNADAVHRCVLAGTLILDVWWCLQVATHEVYEYIICDDVWVAKAPLPLPRFRHAAASVGGAAYVFGGQESCSGTADAVDCAGTTSNSIQAFFDMGAAPMYLHKKV